MIKLFNLDLHISVIEDFKYIIKELYEDKIEIVDWSISGHAWVFNKLKKNVNFINADNWKKIDTQKMEQFVAEYYDFLIQFDGFIVTHTPIFCLLYEKFNKPIIVINSTRYEQPYSFTNNINSWNVLNKKLKEMYDKKQVVFISNNKADYEYLKLGTDIESIILPSLCLYTNTSYNPITNIFLINNNYNIPENNVIKNKSSVLSDGYKWHQLYSCKGIIHIPYEISTMSLFEQYSANVPLFIPTKEYLKKLITQGCKFQSRYNKINGNYTYPDNVKRALDDNTWIDFWVDNADYYDCENMKHIIYFDSNDDLNNLVKTIDTNDISNKMAEHNKIRKKYILGKWKKIMDGVFNL